MRSRIVLALLSLGVVITAASAEDRVVGKTYSIAEPDALTEIEGQAARVHWEKTLEVDTERVMEGGAISLPVTETATTRYFEPEHIVEHDVTDRDGNVVYPAGHRVKYLEYVAMPFRVLVARKADIPWLKREMKRGDQLLVSGGGAARVSQELGTTGYPLTRQLAERLGLEHVPAVVEKEGAGLRVQEILPEAAQAAEGGRE